MFGRFNRFCNPYKRWLGLALIVLGVILLLIFVPFQLWLTILGALFVLLGILFLKG